MPHFNIPLIQCQHDVYHGVDAVSDTPGMGEQPEDSADRTVPVGLLMLYLEHQGMSQREFADRIGESPATLTNWKKRGIPWNKVSNVVTAMGINLGEYLADPEGKNYLNAVRISQVTKQNGTGSALPSTYSIPRLDVGGGMGPGRVEPERETVVGTLDINQTWVRSNLPHISSPANLRVITGYGDSMEGTYDDGDILFVDTGYGEIRLDAVYVFSLSNEMFIKRLQRRPDGSLWVISDNKKYDPYPIPKKDRNSLRVIGRVVWAWNGKRL